MNQFRSTLQAFLIALLATVLMSIGRRFVFIPVFGINFPIMPFILAVTLATWIGGWKSGLFALVLNAVLLGRILNEEVGYPLLSTLQLLRLFVFIVISWLISWGIEALHAARQRAEDRQRELECEVIERRNAEAKLVAEMHRREQVETKLREREERVRLAVESADIGTWDVNPVTGEQEWSNRAKLMFGLSPDAELTSVSFRDRVHPEDLERVNEALQKAFDPSGDGAYEIDCRLVWPDNSIHWFIAKGQAVFEGEKPNRRAIRFIGTVFDISERKHAEQALRQAEDKFRNLATHAPVGIFQTDAQGRCLFVNDTWCAIAGVGQVDAMGVGWARFLVIDYRLKAARVADLNGGARC